MTKLFALGALGAGAAYAGVRAKRRADAKKQAIDAFDYGDLDEPVIVTEEVVVVTEAGPYEIDMELIPADEVGQNQAAQTPNQGRSEESTFEPPGRGAGPR